jgi:hypothetical protein
VIPPYLLAISQPSAAGFDRATPVEELPPLVPEGIERTEGSGFRYESRGCRYPFVSLALGLNVLMPYVRPPGLNGMLI